MKDTTKYYWTTKTGERVDVDEMSTQHLRSVLKMLIRQNQKQVGNIERNFIEDQIDSDYCDATESDLY